MTNTLTASQRITEEVRSWPGVEAGPGRRGEFAFKLGRREIGHLHGDHAAHFSSQKTSGPSSNRRSHHSAPSVPRERWTGRAQDRERGRRARCDRPDAVNYERASARQSRRSKSSHAELGYLAAERRLARLATVSMDGTPHVVPVGFSYNADRDVIDVSGHDLPQTPGASKAALVTSAARAPLDERGDRRTTARLSKDSGTRTLESSGAASPFTAARATCRPGSARRPAPRTRPPG